MADVLLVDDDGSVLLTLAIALRRHGHKVTVAADAHQALGHLRNHHFQFMVSDVRMPGMSGVELAAEVQALAQRPRVILTSAYSHIEARNGTAEAFLRKPIDIDQLHALLSATNDDISRMPANNGEVAAPQPVAPATAQSMRSYRNANTRSLGHSGISASPAEAQA